MKKLFTLFSICALILAHTNTKAQCVIDNNNFTPGFSPASLPCIEQGTSYGRSVQIYVPSSFGFITVDSVHVSDISGRPVNINYTFNPASGTILGGSHACIWFSGTTSDTVGNYPLSLVGTAYTNSGPIDLSSALISSYFTFALSVCQAQVSICDTIFNLVSPLDTPALYTLNALGYTGTGYASGNNSYTDMAKAEGFTGTIGAHINGAFLSFGLATINPADSNNLVKVYAWDNSGTGGSPGAVFDSATITLRQIAAEVTASYTYFQTISIYVPFNSSVALTDTTFYVGVVLPTIEGDTIALFTNIVDPGVDGNGWEQLSDGSWASYLTDYTFTYGNNIAAVACVTGYTPLAQFSANPNSGCAGDTVQFQDMSTNTPTSWHWTFTNGSPSTSTAQNPKVVYSAAGSSDVTLIATNAFGSDMAIHNGYITIYSNPTESLVTNTPASGSTTADGSITVNATSGTAPYTYNWNNLDTGATISNLVPGSYTVTVTDSHNCTVVGNPVTVTFTNGINSIGDNNQVKIYPNPAAEQLNLQWSTVVDAEISIVDVNGKIVHKFVTNGKLLNTFDIHDLSSGSYVIHIIDLNTKRQQSAIFNKL